MDREFADLIDLIDEPRRSKVLEMFADLWDRFSMAPASAKFHGSFKGGLLEHTFNVVEASRSLWALYQAQKPLKTTLESLTFCALVHDIGKIGTMTENLYVDVGMGKFDYSKNFRIDHELLTLFWLSHYGIRVSADEMAAIYYHAGPYVDAHKKVAETDLLMLLHSADNLSAKVKEA